MPVHPRVANRPAELPRGLTDVEPKAIGRRRRHAPVTVDYIRPPSKHISVEIS